MRRSSFNKKNQEYRKIKQMKDVFEELKMMHKNKRTLEKRKMF